MSTTPSTSSTSSTSSSTSSAPSAPSAGSAGSAPGELGELTYAGLVAEARTLLPALYPGWTDHNPSDPGIALVELFAWLTEMLAYQLDEIPDAYTWSFLSLLGGPDWRPPTEASGADLGVAVAVALRELERRHRAVTAADYEHLLRVEWPGSPEAARLGEPGAARLGRVGVVARRDLTRPPETIEADAPAHVSVLVVPPPSAADPRPAPTPGLIAAVAAFLEPRRLLTTRVRVVGPAYADVGIAARLGLRDDAPPEQALAGALDALRAAFDPFTGGPGGAGRTFGSPVYLSDVYGLLDALPLVDFVEDVALAGGRPVPAEDDSVAAISLAPHELAVVARVELVAYDRYRRPSELTWAAGGEPG